MLKILGLTLALTLISNIAFADWAVLSDNSECITWNPEPQFEEEISWTGECKSIVDLFGIPPNVKYVVHGEGILTYTNVINGKMHIEKYVGNMKKGFQNGQGKILYADGTIVVGKWYNGLFDGKITITEPTGEIFYLMFDKGELILE